MSFQEAVRSVLTNYAQFEGRARRSEFWYWFLANIGVGVIVVILFVISRILGDLIYIVWLLGIIVPNLAVGCRRLHDSGKSGWLQLIGIIPFFGGIVLLVLFCLDSTPGPNKYGPSPKQAIGY